jgi:hypothetical protein
LENKRPKPLLSLQKPVYQVNKIEFNSPHDWKNSVEYVIVFGLFIKIPEVARESIFPSTPPLIPKTNHSPKPTTTLPVNPRTFHSHECRFDFPHRQGGICRQSHPKSPTSRHRESGMPDRFLTRIQRGIHGGIKGCQTFGA